MPEDNPSDEGLWNDPLHLDPNAQGGPVLLAEVIRRYVALNLLIQKSDFEAGEGFGAKLKGASYTMTPHPHDAWMFNENGQQVRLKEEQDPDGVCFIVPKHSLVFVRLRQTLRVPFYIIGRHNLKIRYVYQGLLLGTGPQVDPGYVGQLIIPLHNLTTRDVQLFIERSFVSIDFVRTTPLDFERVPPKTKDELYERYEKPKSLIERPKVEERLDLPDYLGPLAPQSAMWQILKGYEKMRDDLNTLRLNVENSVAELKQTQSAFESKSKTDFEKSVNTFDGVQRDFRADVSERLGRAERWVKIETMVSAGLLITFMLAGISWVRDYYGDLYGHTYALNARVINIENGLTNGLQPGISNLAAFPKDSQRPFESNVLIMTERMRIIEASLTQVTNALKAISTRTPAAPDPTVPPGTAPQGKP